MASAMAVPCLRPAGCVAHVPSTTPRSAASRRSTRVLAAKGGGGGGSAAAATDGRDITGLSSLRFAKPSAAEMDGLVQNWSSRSCNHEFAGGSADAPDLPEGVKGKGFMVTKNRKQVGEGKAAYEAAVKAVKAWQHLQLGWNCTTAPSQKVGSTLCSATQTVVPWSVLPAAVTYCSEGAAEFGPGNKGKRFAVGLSSLTGHQLAGEERFQVELHADGSVWYDIFLFARPDTLLAWASLPVVKVMQIRYVTDGVKRVEALLQA